MFSTIYTSKKVMRIGIITPEVSLGYFNITRNERKAEPDVSFNCHLHLHFNQHTLNALFKSLALLLLGNYTVSNHFTKEDYFSYLNPYISKVKCRAIF